MPLALSIAELTERFPQFRVALVVAEGLELRTERPAALDALVGEGLELRTERPAALDALVADREAACRARFERLEPSQIPGIAAWRAAYKGFGIKKTSYRSSVERLVRRVKAGERLPAVNTLVDVYNAVSLEHVLCCGADDLDRIAPPLAFRFARAGDSFVDMGAEPGEDGNDPPKEGEVVYADARHVLCRRWNWRQDARTGLSEATRRAVITIQANGEGDLAAAVDDLAALIRAFCRGAVRHAVADAATPTIEV